MSSESRTDANADAPNVVLVMAGGTGYSDVGCYGGEIETPTLDALADDGLRYSQFYNVHGAVRRVPVS